MNIYPDASFTKSLDSSWFEAPNRLQSYEIRIIAIQKDGTGTFRAIKMTRTDGALLNHKSTIGPL